MPVPSGQPRRPFRLADQVFVAALLVVALAAMAAWCFVQGGGRGRLVEIDRAEPLTARFEVDINTADWPELTQLPGIGTALAQRIVESRQTLGPFRDNEDLRRVRGIGPRKLDAIRGYLRPLPDRRALGATPPNPPGA